MFYINLRIQYAGVRLFFVANCSLSIRLPEHISTNLKKHRPTCHQDLYLLLYNLALTFNLEFDMQVSVSFLISNLPPDFPLISEAESTI